MNRAEQGGGCAPPQRSAAPPGKPPARPGPGRCPSARRCATPDVRWPNRRRLAGGISSVRRRRFRPRGRFLPAGFVGLIEFREILGVAGLGKQPGQHQRFTQRAGRATRPPRRRAALSTAHPPSRAKVKRLHACSHRQEKLAIANCCGGPELLAARDRFCTPTAGVLDHVELAQGGLVRRR